MSVPVARLGELWTLFIGLRVSDMAVRRVHDPPLSGRSRRAHACKSAHTHVGTHTHTYKPAHTHTHTKYTQKRKTQSTCITTLKLLHWGMRVLDELKCSKAIKIALALWIRMKRRQTMLSLFCLVCHVKLRKIEIIINYFIQSTFVMPTIELHWSHCSLSAFQCSRASGILF